MANTAIGTKKATNKSTRKQSNSLTDGLVVISKHYGSWISDYFKSFDDMRKQMLNGDYSLDSNARVFMLNGGGEVKISMTVEQVPVTHSKVTNVTATVKGKKSNG